MKKLIYGLVGLFLVFLILCFIGPSTTHIHREIQINRSVATLMDTLYDFKFFQEKWSPWTAKDPSMKVEYRGEIGVKGSSLAWESKHEEVGKGSMTYRYTSKDTVMMNLHFDDFGDSKLYFLVREETPTSATVSWNMFSENSFFTRAFLLFMNMDKLVGSDFEKGLKTLKSELEKSNNAS